MSPSDFSSAMSKSSFWKNLVWIKLYQSRYSLVDGSIMEIEKWDTPSVQRSQTPCLPTIFPSFHGNRGQFHFCEEITLRGVKNRNAQWTSFTESSSCPLQMGHCMSGCGWLLWSTILIACHHLFSFVFSLHFYISQSVLYLLLRGFRFESYVTIYHADKQEWLFLFIATTMIVALGC